MYVSTGAINDSHLVSEGASALLLDDNDFHVCDSNIDGMDGRYVLSDEFKGDGGTPVFVREDEDGDDEVDGHTSVDDSHLSDFRLFRHGGFWMFADFGSWPPDTHFRCDPTKQTSDSDSVDLLMSCGVNYPQPPMIGYTPANPEREGYLVLQQLPCQRALASSMHNEL